jgi:hypothetical protein
VNSIYLEQLKTAGTEMKTGLQNSKQSKQFDYKFKDQTYFLSFPDEKKRNNTTDCRPHLFFPPLPTSSHLHLYSSTSSYKR